SGLTNFRASEGFASNTCVDEFLYPWSLQCHCPKKVGGISESDVRRLRVRGNLVLDPRDVRVDARSVYYRQVLLMFDPINVQVVDDSSPLVTHQRVLALANVKFADVVGQCLVEKSLRSRAADLQLAHVRDIEEARRRAHG